MFYISDVSGAIRDLLNDKTTPYRFGDELILEYVVEALREIHRLRSDTRIDSRGQVQFIDECYAYTPTESYLIDYDKIVGWDRNNGSTLYFKMLTATSSIGVYTSSDNRILEEDVALIANSGSIGVKTVLEENDSGFSGRVKVIEPPALEETWEVSVVESAMDLDELFISPIINFVVSRCFDIDSEDLEDSQLSQKYYQKFMGGIS